MFNSRQKFHNPQKIGQENHHSDRFNPSHPHERRDLVRKLYKFTGDLDEIKATFCSPSEVWCLLAPSSITPQEREFDVDSGASMHVMSRKDLNSADLITVRVSRNAAKVCTG